MKKALHRSIIREIYQSKARFLSILLIILLGVCFYAGIKATGPDMLNTASEYYQKNQLMDTKITSPLGINEEDLNLVEELKDVSRVEGSYALDVNQASKNQVIHLMSYRLDDKKSLNQPVITQGRLPEKSGELVLDQRASDLKAYHVGDTINFEKAEGSEGLAEKQYQVVGFVNSPLYIDRISRGNTMVGKGSIDYFALVPFDDFSLDDYTELYIQYRQTEKENSYSSTYKKQVEQAESKVATQLKEVANDKYKQQQTTFTEAEAKLKTGQSELEQTQKDLLTKQKELKQQKAQLLALGTPETAIPEEMKSAEAQLGKGLAKIESQSIELTKQAAELKESQQLFDQLDAEEYTFQTRESDPAYAEYQDNADRLSSIATVFPVFFFMIAALISLTTMTRMVDEKRNEIGALKALGYTNWEISQKFIVYAVSASLLGSLLGLAIGYHVFPTIIYNAYRSLYNLPDLIITYYWSYSLQSIIVALACTLISALVVLRVDLLSTPAALLRPKAPKPGKRILLERITWIWQRMNFNQKVTARNLFRYKQRMLMTVLGIAGCTAMIVTGFGIKDAIGDIVDLQFSNIWHYDASVILDNDVTASENTDYRKERDQLADFEESLALSQRTIKISKAGVNTQEVTLDTPENVQELAEFITFKDRKTQKSYKLTDNGVIINEKLAQLMSLQPGDTVEIEDGAGKKYRVTVQQIAENYALHFMYMTPTYYEKTFGEKPEYNADLLKFKTSLTKKEKENLAKKLMEVNHVVNVGYTSDIGKQMDDTMGSLNIVVWVLIISAALLAFIVLYNLTNINISERIRELSTIKVLGFYDREVTMYIYRENNLLTVLGILLGWGLGKLLHNFVLKTAEVDVMMFPPIIHPVSYAYAAGLTVLFSLVVMFFMHRKLKHVDMIEALKSVD